MDMPDYASIHELQTAASLVVVPLQASEEAEIGVYEFISKSFARCPINSLYWLSYFKEPKSKNRAYNDHPHYTREVLDSELNAFIEANFIHVVGTAKHKLAHSFASKWEWDISTALFHFTVYDNVFMPDAEARQQQIERLEVDAPPPFWWRPTSNVQIKLDQRTPFSHSELMNIMRARRTNRTSAGGQLLLSQIAHCLYAGLGIVGTIKATSGDVPLSMTPSGGARNPYEAFAIVKRGRDIEPGVYHYCAADHVMEKVNDLPPETQLAELFGDQQWMDEMATVIVLVAALERTMWKYQDPNAYRVVLIEAGHIGQNIMLAATELGLTACPSAAMSHSKVSDLLKLDDRAVHVPIYALSLDKAAAYDRNIVSLKREAEDIAA